MEQENSKYDNIVIIGGTNNIQHSNEENNYNAKEEIQRGWKKIDHATKELMENDPSKNLLIVETINSPSADGEKRSASVSTLKKLAKSRKHVKIVGSSKILDEEDFRNDSVHLNESGITKLVEQINSFMKEHNMKEIIRDEHGFLSQRPYQRVTCEYTFGCKICSETHTEEQQCLPHNSSQPQE